MQYNYLTLFLLPCEAVWKFKGIQSIQQMLNTSVFLGKAAEYAPVAQFFPRSQE